MGFSPTTSPTVPLAGYGHSPGNKANQKLIDAEQRPGQDRLHWRFWCVAPYSQSQFSLHCITGLFFSTIYYSGVAAYKLLL